MSKYFQFLIAFLFFQFFCSCTKKNESTTNIKDSHESKQSFDSNNIDSIKINELNEDYTWSTLIDGKSSFKNIQATNYSGAVVLKYNKEERNIILIKYNSLGQIDFEKLISNNYFSKCFLSVNDNNDCLLVVDEKIMIIDSNGEVVNENVFNSNGILGNVCRVYFYENDILIISDYTLLKLDINFKLIKEIYFSELYSRLSDSNNNRKLAINSVAKDSKGNFYFTGKDNDLLWFGKLTNDFNLIWEKSDLELEQSKEKPEVGVTILFHDDDNIFLLSKFSNYSDRGKSVLLSIDSFGKINWRRNLVGICRDDTFSDYLIITNNFLYVFTMDKQFYNRSDVRTYSSYNWEFALINKYNFSGANIFSEEINVDSKRISFNGSAGAKDKSFFVVGNVQSLSPSNNKYISNSSLIKFSPEGKTQNKLIFN
jgi:hypothetical protein